MTAGGGAEVCCVGWCCAAGVGGAIDGDGEVDWRGCDVMDYGYARAD